VKKIQDLEKKRKRLEIDFKLVSEEAKRKAIGEKMRKPNQEIQTETEKIANSRVKEITIRLRDNPNNETEIEKGIKEQTEYLLKTSDLIYLVNSEEDFYSYQTLRLQYFLTISAGKGTNLDGLIKQISALLPHSSGEKFDQKEKELKLLIFGPPNSGKSTLMNYLLQENRSLATPVAGTTQEP
ncbi:4264_t:CDS:2, partial [Scutellospora calospora]